MVRHAKMCPYCKGKHYSAKAFHACEKRYNPPRWIKTPRPK